jgi:hypothetical protein
MNATTVHLSLATAPGRKEAEHLPGKQRVHGDIEGSNGNLASKPLPVSTHPIARYVSPAMAVVG